MQIKNFVRNFFLSLMFLGFCLSGSAQQPQTSTAPIQPENAKYTQGVGPGYWPTVGTGLTLNLAAGTVLCASTPTNYAGGTLVLTDNTTNYVYLNTKSACVPAAKTTTYAPSDIPIATVTTASGAISGIVDLRTPFISPSTPASSGSLGPYFNVTSPVYNPNGTVGTGGCATDISTNATSTVTSAAQLTAGTYFGYSAPKIGDIAWVINTNGNVGPCHTSNASFGITSTLRIPASASTVTTITGVNLGAGTVTLSGSTATTGSGDVLFWANSGDPGDYTAISSACSAVGPSGGTVYAPKGLYIIGTNASNNPTCNILSTVVGTFSLLGDGPDQTMFYTAPWYNDSFNFGSVFALTNSGYGVESGWTLDGGGFARAYGPDTPNDVASPLIDNIQVRNYNLTSGSTEVTYIGSGGGGAGLFYHINNSLFTASGTNSFACAISGPYQITYKNTSCLSARGPLEGTSNSGNMLLNIDGGTYSMFGTNTTGGAALLLPSNGTPGPSIINVFGGANLCSGSGTSTGVAMNRTGWLITLDSVIINSGFTCGTASGNIGGITNISGSTVKIINSTIGASGAGNTLNNPSGGLFYDGGNNTWSGGAGMTGAGTTILSPTSTGLSTPVVTGTGACASPILTGTNSLTFSHTCPGSSGAATLTYTWAANAPNAWNCYTAIPKDTTTPADVFTVTSESATACVYGAAAIVSGDVIEAGSYQER